jgi:hypothetical protein
MKPVPPRGPAPHRRPLPPVPPRGPAPRAARPPRTMIIATYH